MMVMGQSTKGKTEAQIQSLINANAATGLDLSLTPPSVQSQVKLKDGPIYIKGN